MGTDTGKRQPIYILVGTPGSGKTWVTGQLGDKFECLPHDQYGMTSNEDYTRIIANSALTADKPILAETPFSLSQLKDPLEAMGFEVKPVFIIESEEVTTKRYQDRDKRPIPKGHITRIATYLERAKNLSAPHGTSDEMLKYLKSI